MRGRVPGAQLRCRARVYRIVLHSPPLSHVSAPQATTPKVCSSAMMNRCWKGQEDNLHNCMMHRPANP